MEQVPSNETPPDAHALGQVMHDLETTKLEGGGTGESISELGEAERVELTAAMDSEIVHTQEDLDRLKGQLDHLRNALGKYRTSGVWILPISITVAQQRVANLKRQLDAMTKEVVFEAAFDDAFSSIVDEELGNPN